MTKGTHTTRIASLVVQIQVRKRQAAEKRLRGQGVDMGCDQQLFSEWTDA